MLGGLKGINTWEEIRRILACAVRSALLHLVPSCTTAFELTIPFVLAGVAVCCLAWILITGIVSSYNIEIEEKTDTL